MRSEVRSSSRPRILRLLNAARPRGGRGSIPALCLVVLAFTVLGPRSAASRSWYVLPDSTGDAATIQAAIDSCAEGDTVLVAPGTYYGSAKFIDVDYISLISESGPEVTFLDGDPAYNPNRWQPVRIASSTHILIEGFTIMNGNPGYTATNVGGGMRICGRSITVRGNVIRDNNAKYGAAIGFPGGCGLGTTIIEQNQILDNTSPGNSAGIRASNNGGSITVRDNYFSGNEGGYGAIYAGGSTIDILDNVFIGNIATAQIISSDYSNILVEGNLLVGNQGHAVACVYGTVRNNTAVDNTGVGLSCSFGTIENNISVGNDKGIGTC